MTLEKILYIYIKIHDKGKWKKKKGKRKENIERKNRVKNRVRTKKRDLTGNRRRVRKGIKRKTEKLSQGTK